MYLWRPKWFCNSQLMFRQSSYFTQIVICKIFTYFTISYHECTNMHLLYKFVTMQWAMLQLDIVPAIFNCIPSKLSFTFWSENPLGGESICGMNYKVHVAFWSMHSPNNQYLIVGGTSCMWVFASHLLS